MKRFLDAEWKWTLKHAWSFRLWVLASLLGFAQAMLDYFAIPCVPGWVTGVVAWLLGVAGIIARFAAQAED